MSINTILNIPGRRDSHSRSFSRCEDVKLFRELSCNVTIKGYTIKCGSVDFLSGPVDYLSGPVDFLSGPVDFLSGPVESLWVCR